MTAVILRGDAASLPLPDESADLIVTSPPYHGMRSYSDGGEVYDGQIGSETTPGEYLEALQACTREWIRVLKPEGSLFVNLGDRYATRGRSGQNRTGVGEKSLIGLPWRYALGCVDHLGLTLRAEVVWSKPSGMPESVTDRVRRSHEQVFHFTKSPRYFAAVDEIRQPHLMRPQRRPGGHRERQRLGVLPAQTYSTSQGDEAGVAGHPLGALPGSVWEIAAEPLRVPDELGISHFAAYPTALVRRIILGWSPPGICTSCGQGRRPVAPVVAVEGAEKRAHRHLPGYADPAGVGHRGPQRVITGYACACTPCTDHKGTGEPSGPYGRHAAAVAAGTYENVGADWGGKSGLGDRPRVGPWREYHLEAWTPPPARPAIVVDPFAGTGTTMLTASVLGRIGIGVDRSMDYCRLAAWRCSDPGERARAMGVRKPPPVPDGQGSLFDGLEAS